MIAPPACHSPFTPAPQFAHKFADRRAPRWPSFNRHPGMDKHWLVRQAPFGPLPQKIVNEVDHIFRQRWRTLLSVDHMVSIYNFAFDFYRKCGLSRLLLLPVSDWCSKYIPE